MRVMPVPAYAPDIGNGGADAQAETFPSHRDLEERNNYAVMVIHFRHPRHGDILIDTGFDRSYHENPPRANLSVTMRLYGSVMNVQYIREEADIDLGSQLEKREIIPAHVFLTHLHADHPGGLPSLFSHCHIHFGEGDITLVSRLLCGNHLKGKSSVHLMDVISSESLAPFTHAVDIFGNVMFWALFTPGHTPDHLAYLINTAPTPVFISGDAELTAWAMDDKILVSAVDGASGREAVQNSANMIRPFHFMYPDVPVSFSHDEDHL